MTCAFCGMSGATVPELCLHHTLGEDAEWSQVNRIMCEAVHRGNVPHRLPKQERDAVVELADPSE